MPRERFRKIFTADDFSEADRIGKLYIHMMQPDDFELTYQEEEYLERLKKVWGLMGKKMAKMRRIYLIAEEFDIHHRNAFKLLHDAQELFGDILKQEKETELLIMKERYYELSDKASKEDDYDTARKCLEAAERIIEKLEAMKPAQKREYATVIFTSDPKALQANNNVDEIDFEELGQAGLLEPEAVAVPAGNAAD